MKILEIIPSLSSGGAERFVVDLCNELCKNNDITLLLLYPLENAYAFYLPFVNKKINVISLNKPLGFSFKSCYKIFKFIKNYHFDIVHIHISMYYVIMPSILIKNTKFYHTIHNNAKIECINKLHKPLNKILYKYLIKPVTISKESQKSYETFYHLFNSKMIINGRNIPNVIVSQDTKNEILKYKRDENTIIITSVARLTDQKRPWILSRVTKKLIENGYNISTFFIGRKDNQKIVNNIESLDCKNIHILGEKKNPLEYLSISDCFVLFSEYEGMPISLIEALGVGCTPICTPVGGITNVIKTGENGILANSIDENDCYTALKQFLDLSFEKRSIMKSKVIESYQPYSMTKCAKLYYDYFNEKIEK